MVAPPLRAAAVRGGGVAAVVATFVILLTLGSITAFAHALLVASSPAPGATLEQSPASILITFSERPDPRLSAIHVVDSLGLVRDRGPTTAVPGTTELEVAIPRLSTGVYTVTWRTVSAVDGHLATGAFAFGIGVAPANVPLRADLAAPPPSGGTIAGRAVLYVGMVALFGMAVIALAAFPDPPLVVLRLLPLAAAILVVGVVVVGDEQRADAGLALSDYVGSSLFHILLDRAVPAVVAVVAVGLTLGARGPHPRRLGLLGVAGAAAVAMLMDVDTSHATAGGLPRLNGAFQWMHTLGVGIWIGGLAALLAGIRGASGEVAAQAVRRFSMIAGGAVVVVGLTGVLRAGVEVGSLPLLTSSLFGQLVLVKVGLFAILATLGAINRYRHVPRLPPALRGVRRIGSTEIAVALVTLTVAGTLVSTVPPAPAASARAPLDRAASITASLGARRCTEETLTRRRAAGRDMPLSPSCTRDLTDMAGRGAQSSSGRRARS